MPTKRLLRGTLETRVDRLREQRAPGSCSATLLETDITENEQFKAAYLAVITFYNM